MPQQHRSKHAPKPPAKGAAGAAQASQEAAASNPDWQRSQGGFSAKAKKEYLQWKRQQKAAARDDSSSSDEGGGCQQGGRNSSKHSSSGSHHRAGAVDGTATPPPRPARQQQQLSSTAPLCYRPLVAVPAAPFCASQLAAAGAAATGAAGVNGGPDSCTTTTYMPRLNPAEVGFTRNGFALGMPTRPDWRGVVRNAEQLHALEEQQFDAWQATLLAAATAGQHAASSAAAGPHAATADASPSPSVPRQQEQEQQEEHEEDGEARVMPGAGTARAGGVGRLSFYEGRLEFWRQLWRTLDLSDVVLLIVDARNPLLHFSHALYHHVTQHHRLPLLLLLNKCDLVPAAAVGAWQQWLQQQLPGVVVVPVSAAPDQAPAAARAVLEAVMKLPVERGGHRVAVADVVGASVDEVIEESIARNTHAKRHILQQQQQQQQGQQHGAAAEEAATAAADPAAALAAAEAERGGSEGEEGGDWSLKPTRAARKAGRRAPRRRGQQEQPPTRLTGQPGTADGRDTSAASADGSDDDDACSSDGGGSSDGDSSSSSSNSPELRQLSAQLDALTVEARLSAAAAAQPADSSAAGAGSSSDDGGSSSWRLDPRPVVLGLLGEPNVGKSSTLNALLGSHRVSVSAHPGRTKHFQTHMMSDRLVLCDCPGIVFPRLDVSLPMQVLFGSYPIANCRDLAAVVAYLAASSWPRLQDKLGLRQPDQQQGQQQQQQPRTDPSAAQPGAVDGGSDGWSAAGVCEALADKRHWVLPRSGRLDTYRAANWLLRAALAGKGGLGLAFLPPEIDVCAGGDAHGDAAAS